MLKKIVIKGAKEHNLKNISLEIPKDKFIVITGLSGSGKSSLAFDTIYAEGQRRYVESLSAYARQFLDKMKKPKVDLDALKTNFRYRKKELTKNIKLLRSIIALRKLVKEKNLKGVSSPEKVQNKYIEKVEEEHPFHIII